MTLLLKRIWRNALRNTPVKQSTVRVRSLMTGSSEVKPHKTQDTTMLSLKTALTYSDILRLVQANLPQMTHRHMLQAFRSLFQLQKASRYDNSDELIKDPGFGVLCQNFNKHARQIDVNEAIEAIKILSYLGVPVDSLILQTLFQIIRSEINEIGIRQIMFLDFILHRFKEKNHLIDALKMALPLAFQIHLPLELDNDDMQLLKEMLAYSCQHNLPDRCINNVVTGLLLHDQNMDTNSAKSIITYLSNVNCTEEVYPTRCQLLQICFGVVAENVDELTYSDVLRLAARLKTRIMDKHPEFYHEELMDALAGYVVKNEMDFEKSLLVARVLSRIAHTHMGLIEYICDLAASEPTTLSECRTNILFGFINCLSNSNYIPPPKQWQEIHRQITSNTILDGKGTALPWVKTCLELASLGIYEDKILNKVFTKDFISDYLSKDYNRVLDYMQLLTLYVAANSFHGVECEVSNEIVEKAMAVYPLSGMTDDVGNHLGMGLGGSEYVTKNVIMPCGIITDLLICLKAGYPVKIERNSKETKVPFDQLKLPKDSILVCILNFKEGCYSMNSNRLRGSFRLLLDILEHHGYAAVGVNVTRWMELPGHERTPYLIREIGYKCGEIGIKLSAT